jgi:hypothetical protein
MSEVNNSENSNFSMLPFSSVKRNVTKCHAVNECITTVQDEELVLQLIHQDSLGRYVQRLVFYSTLLITVVKTMFGNF